MLLKKLETEFLKRSKIILEKQKVKLPENFDFHYLNADYPCSKKNILKEKPLFIGISEKSRLNLILNTLSFFPNFFYLDKKSAVNVFLPGERDLGNKEIFFLLDDQSSLNFYSQNISEKNFSLKVLSCGKGTNFSLQVGAKASLGEKKLKIEGEIRGEKNKGFMEIKAISENSAKLSIEAKIKIRKTAKQSDARLDISSLILGDNSTVLALPILEIEQNDVRAKHSASICNIKDEDLFYLSARGINKEKAKTLLIDGFLSSIMPKKEISGIIIDAPLITFN